MSRIDRPPITFGITRQLVDGATTSFTQRLAPSPCLFSTYICLILNPLVPLHFTSLRGRIKLKSILTVFQTIHVLRTRRLAAPIRADRYLLVAAVASGSPFTLLSSEVIPLGRHPHPSASRYVKSRDPWIYAFMGSLTSYIR